MLAAKLRSLLFLLLVGGQSIVMVKKDHACRYDGCSAKMRLRDLLGHEVTCLHRPLPCLFGGSKCDLIPVQKMVEHFRQKHNTPPAVLEHRGGVVSFK